MPAQSAFVNALKTLSQLLAILCVAILLGMIAHKAHSDISALVRQHSGGSFAWHWRATSSATSPAAARPLPSKCDLVLQEKA